MKPASAGRSRKHEWLNIDNESDEQIASFLGLDRMDRLPPTEFSDWTPPGRRSADQGSSSDQPLRDADYEADEPQTVEPGDGRPETTPLENDEDHPAERPDPGQHTSDRDSEPREPDTDQPKATGENDQPSDRPRLTEAEAREHYDPERFQKMLTDRPGELSDDERTKAWGMLYGADGQQLWDKPNCSRNEGPATEVGWRALGLPNEHMNIQRHLEAHVAAQMRQEGPTECSLYIDRAVCPYDRTDEPVNWQRWWQTCHYWLEDMLPPDAHLTIYGPDNFCKVYVGKPEENP